MVTFRRSACLLGSGILGLTLVGVGPADAATVLGSTFVPNVSGSCSSLDDWQIFQTSAATGPSAQAPTAGVITSWSYVAGPDDASLALRVFRQSPVVGSYTVVADSGPLQNVAALSGLHTFSARVSVRAGDYVGLHSTKGWCASFTSNNADVIADLSGPLTPVGGTAAYTALTGVLVDLSSTLEVDLDGDGFGDETQDGCPTSAATQASCTDTTITKKPKARSHGPKSRLTFTSSLAGSTFVCSIDGKKGKACTSPAAYRCLKPGRHRFTVAATSPFGYVDPTPARAGFRVSPDRRGC